MTLTSKIMRVLVEFREADWEKHNSFISTGDQVGFLEWFAEVLYMRAKPRITAHQMLVLISYIRDEWDTLVEINKIPNE